MIKPTNSTLADVERLLGVAALSLKGDDHGEYIHSVHTRRIGADLGDERQAAAWELLAYIVVEQTVIRGLQNQLADLMCDMDANDRQHLIVEHLVDDVNGDLPPNYYLALDFALPQASDPRWLASHLPLVVEAGLRVIISDHAASATDDCCPDPEPSPALEQVVLDDIVVHIRRLCPAVVVVAD